MTRQQRNTILAAIKKLPHKEILKAKAQGGVHIWTSGNSIMASADPQAPGSAWSRLIFMPLNRPR